MLSKPHKISQSNLTINTFFKCPTWAHQLFGMKAMSSSTQNNPKQSQVGQLGHHSYRRVRRAPYIRPAALGWSHPVASSCRACWSSPYTSQPQLWCGAHAKQSFQRFLCILGRLCDIILCNLCNISIGFGPNHRVNAGAFVQWDQVLLDCFTMLYLDCISCIWGTSTNWSRLQKRTKKKTKHSKAAPLDNSSSTTALLKHLLCRDFLCQEHLPGTCWSKSSKNSPLVRPKLWKITRTSQPPSTTQGLTAPRARSLGLTSSLDVSSTKMRLVSPSWLRMGWKNMLLKMFEGCCFYMEVLLKYLNPVSFCSQSCLCSGFLSLRSQILIEPILDFAGCIWAPTAAEQRSWQQSLMKSHSRSDEVNTVNP